MTEENIQALRQRLSQMSDAMLAERVRNGHFADFAIGAAQEELARRQLPPTPDEQAESPPEPAGQDLVILQDRLDPAEASVLVSLLESEGIHALSDDPNTAWAFGFLGYVIGGVRVRVPPEQLERAREVLASLAANRYALPDEEQAPPLTRDAQHILAWTRDASLAQRWTSAPLQWPGFHWPAFLFGPVWFFYRKLYKAGTVVLALELLLLFVLNTPPALLVSLWIGLCIAIASCADLIHFSTVRTEVLRLRSLHTDEEALRAALARQGGINFPAALALILLLAIASASY